MEIKNMFMRFKNIKNIVVQYDKNFYRSVVQNLAENKKYWNYFDIIGWIVTHKN